MSDPMKRYKDRRQIGKGSYGKVYLMRDTQTNELVVVKTIPIKSKDTKSKSTAQREAKLLRMMQHPNIIMYLDSFFDSQGDFCIVLEYADGKDLQKYLETHKQIAEKQVLQIFTQIILGLDYIHSQNVLHRDIKTANVFLFRKGLVKLGDFGIAREVQNDELAGTLIGTPYFMCPELLRGQRYGFPADIWAAGCVLFELLAGKHAFTGKSREELFANIMSGKMPQMPTQYSKPLINLLCSMLSQDPAQRPSCKDILATDIIGQGLDALQAKLMRHFGRSTHLEKPISHSNHPSNIPTSSHSKSKSKSKEKVTQSPSSHSNHNNSNNNYNSNNNNSNINHNFLGNISPIPYIELEETDDDIDQGKIPEWLLDNESVAQDLVRQSQRHLEKDANRLLGVIRSSITRISLRSIPSFKAAPPTITGNLNERKKRLEEEARLGLGEKYEIAYKFIQKHGQEKREELISKLKLIKIPERELRMIETLTAIEACE
ncbi:CAMK family protein kinase [Tritrichomonas foetus]|uniref:non-specific serine/threonine protein kinase n=1 Tax=Tritrichomonas foetus TaxID=1144522 RepID=A0A1J4JWM1_9EUKA|nr:CAMK family protein kinase [Tritrichomonas foetus]|eukprot:OHT02848.1 CAMK family protein kinase [Tritrichomonas foetus]